MLSGSMQVLSNGVCMKYASGEDAFYTAKEATCSSQDLRSLI